MKKIRIHLLVVTSLIIWKLISADWILCVPWYDGTRIAENSIHNIPAPNSTIWTAPEWVFDSNDSRYNEWINSVHGYWESTGMTHPTGPGSLEINWILMIIKIISSYTLFYFFYILIKAVKKIDKMKAQPIQ